MIALALIFQFIFILPQFSFQLSHQVLLSIIIQDLKHLVDFLFFLNRQRTRDSTNCQIFDVIF